jgi:hypothetical protein
MLVPARRTSVFMRSSSASLARLLMKGGGLALLWLLVPSIATAMPAPRHGLARCNPHTITLHKLARIAASFSGPVASRHKADPLPRLSNGGVRLDRDARVASSGDDAAIQNDAPAACADADAGPAFALEPIGVLTRAILRPPTTVDCSRRSPRGPPVAG